MLNKFDMAVFLVTVVSLLFSVFLWFNGQRDEGIFVGLWVPSLLGIGIYLKGIMNSYKES
jgi:hypothetical protein